MRPQNITPSHMHRDTTATTFAGITIVATVTQRQKCLVDLQLCDGIAHVAQSTGFDRREQFSGHATKNVHDAAPFVHCLSHLHQVLALL